MLAARRPVAAVTLEGQQEPRDRGHVGRRRSYRMWDGRKWTSRGGAGGGTGGSGGTGKLTIREACHQVVAITCQRTSRCAGTAGLRALGLHIARGLHERDGGRDLCDGRLGVVRFEPGVLSRPRPEVHRRDEFHFVHGLQCRHPPDRLRLDLPFGRCLLRAALDCSTLPAGRHRRRSPPLWIGEM
jgi:hypothetical protein